VGADEPHGVVYGAGLGHDLAVGFGLEQAPQAAAHDGVIVGQHHSDPLLAHGATVVAARVLRVRAVPSGRCGFARIRRL
jgi:hypothetical protein